MPGMGDNYLKTCPASLVSGTLILRKAATTYIINLTKNLNFGTVL
jgi:hypothetical protein